MKKPAHKRKTAHQNVLSRIGAFIGSVTVLLIITFIGIGYIAPESLLSSSSSDQVSTIQDRTPSLDNSASTQPSTNTNATSEAASSNPYSHMETDTYEPGKALIALHSAEEAEEISSKLAQYDFVLDASLNDLDTSAGFIVVSFTSNEETLTSIGKLLDEGFCAQPNRILYIDDQDTISTPNDSGIQITNETPENTSTEPVIQSHQKSDIPFNPDSYVDEPTTSYHSDETLFENSVSINDYDTYPEKSWALKAMNAFDAWTIQKGEDSTVSVAVIDTGCNINHEDLADGIIAATYNAVNGGSDVADNNGHGTHVSGVVSARANNGKGAAGITYNGKVVPIKANNADNTFDEATLTRAVTWAITHKDDYDIRVINMSIASANDSEAQAYQEASANSVLIGKLKDATQSGILVICAAGNNVNSPTSGGKTGPYYNFPSDYLPEGIGVIALNTSLRKTTYSNYNASGQKTKDISAPGDSIYSTNNNGGYKTSSGTSQATPAVAGVAALLFAISPTSSPAEISNILCDTADDLGAQGWDETYGSGLVNAYKAVQTLYKEPILQYEGHVQDEGWMGMVREGQTAGTSGRALRVEALRLRLSNNSGYPGGIEYSGHVENKGWQDPQTLQTDGNSTDFIDGPNIMGTYGKALRVEAIRLNLTGELANHYSIYYRTHVQDVGWTNWVKNGAEAGTAGLALRLEAIQIVIARKSSNEEVDIKSEIAKSDVPGAIDATKEGLNGVITYSAIMHIQDKGDISFVDACGTDELGTTGQAKRVEALTLFPQLTAGGVRYKTHIQDIGWQNWRTDGETSGTQGQSKRLEALALELTGEAKNNYDVYYRTHIQNIGWTGWAKNGQKCGSEGYAYRMEAMQIVFIEKGGTAPGMNTRYFYKR